MPRIWFNRTYATVARSLEMVRRNPQQTPVTLIGTHPDATSPVLRACDLAFSEPDLDGDDYADWALDFALRHRVDVFVPRLNQAAIAANAGRFADAGVGLACPSAAVVHRFADKARAFEAVAATDLAVGLAPWRTAQTADELQDALHSLRAEIGPGARLCVKPTEGVGGAGFRILVDERPTLDDLLGFVAPVAVVGDLLDALRAVEREGRPAPMLLLQPVLDTPEISVDVLAAPGGRLLAAVPRAKTRRVRTLINDSEAIRYAAGLVAEFGISYLANVQLRFWRGERVLLEVNTRASGGLYQTELAGVHLLWDAVRLAMGVELQPLPVRLGASYALLDELVPLH